MGLSMEDLARYTEAYGVFVAIFLVGGAFGYAVSLNMRVTEIALDLWPEGARDCLPFLTPPWGGPLKFVCVAIAFGLTFSEAQTRGGDAWLYGVTAFLIGFAAIYGWIGDKEKTERWLPGMHERMKIRRGQLKTIGQIDKATALETLIKKFEENHPQFRAPEPKPRMKGPFGG